MEKMKQDNTPISLDELVERHKKAEQIIYDICMKQLEQLFDIERKKIDESKQGIQDSEQGEL